jgi:hypothetical protein
VFRKRMLYFLFVLFVFSITGLLQANATIPQRGERLFIDITKMPAESMEDGVIQVKFRQEFSDFLGDTGYGYDDNGIVTFKIDALDSLNKRYEVRGVKPMFDSPALDNEFKQRHRDWGFHLWYELRFESQHDIIDVVMAYREIVELEIVEPEYKKRMIGAEINDLGTSGFLTEEISTRDWIPEDPQFNSQWHYHNTGQQNGTPGADISLPEAWEMEKGDASVIVAIIDDGIEYNHADLAGNMWDQIGYNFVDNSANINPGNHGTHVAGTVAAVSNNNIGVAGIAGGSGLSDGVRLMSCQVFSGNNSGGFHTAMIYAADNDATISQNSWGYTTVGAYNQNILDAIDYFNQHGGGDSLDGGITVFAAGNDNSSGMWYPGFYAGAFAVAATNNNDSKAWYSNYDTWIDVSAPGGETNQVNGRGVLSTVTGTSYSYYQGTSMACPHVSGVAALIASYTFGNLTAADLADILVSSTDDHYNNNPSYIGLLGSGRINAHSALVVADAYVDGVLNPRSFTATTISQSEIDLQWQPNDSYDPVLLAWSPDGMFGTPVDGELYTHGQSLPGGGIVILQGYEEDYLHQYLNPATNYYYRAWSYNFSNEYSFGRNVNSRTMEIPQLPPIEENFNDQLSSGWSIIDNNGNGQIWEIGTMGNGLTGTTGDYAFVNSSSHGMFGSQDTDILSPVLDFSSYTDVTVSFTHFYEHRSFWIFSSTASFYYSTNGGDSWVEIQTWEASTANPAFYSQALQVLDGQTDVRFRWNYSGNSGFHWCIDDIVLSGTVDGVAEIEIDPETVNLAAYPDAEISEVVNIENDGSVPLLYSANIVYNDGSEGWLMISPSEGIVYPDDESGVMISANTFSLEAGFYSALVLFENNAEEPVIIDVNLEVLSLFQPPYDVTASVENINNVMISWEFSEDSRWQSFREMSEPTSNVEQTGLSRISSNRFREEGFAIYRNGELIAELDDLNDTEFFDEGLDSGSYEYIVRAQTAEGISAPSEPVSVDVTLLPPTDLSAYVENEVMVLNWNAPEGGVNISSYRIYRDETLIGEVETEQFIDDDSIDQTHVYEVSAVYNESYESEMSDGVTIDFVGITQDGVPLITELHQNYPNPFNPETNIKFSLAEDGHTRVEIYNISGRRVKTLVDEFRNAGCYTVVWNGTDEKGKQVGSGVYFYKFTTSNESTIRKMLLLK